MSFVHAVLALSAAASLSNGQRTGQRPGHAPVPHTGFGPDQDPSGGVVANSPAFALYSQPLPIPALAQPDYAEEVDGRTIEFYFDTIEPFQHQVYPDLGPANMIGYNGTSPGPTYRIKKGTETIVRHLNKGTNPASSHLHGSYTHSPWDGWAADEIQPGSYKDYYYPNSESARPIWYHDHAEQITSVNAYYGQAGIWIIYDPAEDALGLPAGDYDIPLAITDKIYTATGDLVSPASSLVNFFGDVIQVNEMPWPYLNVEPRKYRFRFYDMSLSRPYDLVFADSSGDSIPFQVIASDSGLFGEPVTTSDVVISMGERYEVVFDFASYQGQNVSLNNALNLPFITSYDNTDKVMLFVVGDTVSDDSNNGEVPSTLNPDIDYPQKKTTVDHVFEFQGGGDAPWTINGIDFEDTANRVLARPTQGNVEVWELHHTGGPAVHPVHVHLVNFQILSRTGGSRGLAPYETAGLKDIVLLEPGETAQVLAQYAPWNGVYMFHCHNLIHEDHSMLDAFNVTKLEAFGYEFNSTLQFSDPEDARFSAQPYNAAAYEPEAISAVVSSLVALNAYAPASSLLAVESAYWTTAVYTDEVGAPTVSPSPTGKFNPSGGRPTGGPSGYPSGGPSGSPTGPPSAPTTPAPARPPSNGSPYTPPSTPSTNYGQPQSPSGYGTFAPQPTNPPPQDESCEPTPPSGSNQCHEKREPIPSAPTSIESPYTPFAAPTPSNRQPHGPLGYGPFARLPISPPPEDDISEPISIADSVKYHQKREHKIAITPDPAQKGKRERVFRA